MILELHNNRNNQSLDFLIFPSKWTDKILQRHTTHETLNSLFGYGAWRALATQGTIQTQEKISVNWSRSVLEGLYINELSETLLHYLVRVPQQGQALRF